MPSTDITFCASPDCPRRAACERSVNGRSVGPKQSVIDYRTIWGDNCGAFIPWAAEAMEYTGFEVAP